MSRLKRVLLWAALIAIILLAAFSIYGAFLGAERAQAFFNTLPLAVYWFALAGLLIAGMVIFRRLLRVPSLLLMHLGCILIIGGGMWSSKAGHALGKQLFGIDKILEGQMAILERGEDNRVRFADSNDIAELPFSVRLRDFRMEYYEPGALVVQARDGGAWRLPAEPGRALSLGENLGEVRIQRVFENFKIGMEGEERKPYDAPGGSNPALEVTVENPDGTTATRYVFERFPGHSHPEDQLVLRYRRTVSDYISELEIVKDRKVVAAKDIEVNHPLHYGGYHFYQSSYGEDRLGEYTVLMVVSDSGLSAVYAGYAMLIAGICWHFWGRRTLTAWKERMARAVQMPAASQSTHPDTNSRETHGD
ncbi:MAG: cytochrome c biogenesis protein ResB [Sedimentisphaerales bacterium]|nr:cytochrome c biogenesis protein ResB [Sedimentisphaerales bacterium]